MADRAASVLARLKNKAAEKAISFVCSLFARRNFCAVWSGQGIQEIWSSRAACLSTPSQILTAV